MTPAKAPLVSRFLDDHAEESDGDDDVCPVAQGFNPAGRLFAEETSNHCK